MSAKLLTLTMAIFLAVAFGMFLFIDSFGGNLNNEATGLAVSSESFPTYLETHPAVSSLPKSASIGIKIGSYSYDIDGRDVSLTQSLENKDVIISLPEGYEGVIGEFGLCNAVKKAYNDNKLSVETFSSKTTLLLKYIKLLKYKDCVT